MPVYAKTWSPFAVLNEPESVKLPILTEVLAVVQSVTEFPTAPANLITVPFEIVAPVLFVQTISPSDDANAPLLFQELSVKPIGVVLLDVPVF